MSEHPYEPCHFTFQKGRGNIPTMENRKKNMEALIRILKRNHWKVMRFFQLMEFDQSFVRSFWKVPGVERCIAAGPVSTPVGQRQGGLGRVTMGGTTPKRWRFVRGHDEPIHESCAIYFRGGIDESTCFSFNQGFGVA